MPHQCTSCSETFPDGSKEMLSGCPRCGGNTFQYLPAESMDDPPTADPPDPPERPEGPGTVTETVGKAATTVRDYVTHRRSDTPPEPTESSSQDASDSFSTDTPATPQESPEPDSSPADPPGDPFEPATTGADPRDDAEVTADSKSAEDTAQASARGELADISELSDESTASTGSAATEASSSGPRPPRDDGRVVKEPDSPDRPDLETLRAELNDQFESIKILEPGQYELNLMELYDREEHIIALQEDGKYVIEVPESWREDAPDRE